MDLSRTLSHIDGDLSSKLTNCLTPDTYFAAPLTGFKHKKGYRRSGQEQMVWHEYHNLHKDIVKYVQVLRHNTDVWQTDRHTQTPGVTRSDSKVCVRAYHVVGNNDGCVENLAVHEVFLTLWWLWNFRLRRINIWPQVQGHGIVKSTISETAHFRDIVTVEH